ncbi:MAG: tetratricopeptide repeat protein [Alphaproteobacteria bacterium]|nr:tetratricopeptide repeat protein [Alphaproteobacteria bacterium]MBU0802361.1 tetratricopeptide repeat protein [Alphaproteobacteria bacterium]MBU0870197.1 tetratricopeptide repeat protein [Alphaproteobacteria bacterium]MBU1399860.1 tetratricopeptide repeat protein [Alphaproteobacteria bacterium]MBU1590246.1 tetratricopeptide repeat protein [Alphaproteobacteria bacterium]
MQRRLAAILAADVVGYSRMMGQDESGTLGRMTDMRRDMIEPLIARHRGRIVKLMGDGLLVEFSSLVDAVQCAMGWHPGAAGHAANQGPETHIRFRIGINIGDVLIEGDDIHGDGVNIAARLEGLAEPGGTCISADAYRQVRGKVDISFEDMGDHALKNIAEPVRVYRLSGRPGEDAVPAEAEDAPAYSVHQSVAILPFANMSGDPEQEYFADGITEDIITDLAKLPGMFVIARNSSFRYKGKNPDIRQVCRELGVKFALEGSVRKAGSRVRITAQLIEGAKGGHVWAERYDRELEDIFAVQDEVTREIVRALELKMSHGETTRQRADTSNALAYDLVLQGREQRHLFSKESNLRARQLFERAIGVDPDYAAAHAGLALCGLHAWLHGAQKELESAYEIAKHAKALDPSLPVACEALGNVLLFMGRQDEAVAEARQWVELEPGNADAYANLAGALSISGEPEKINALIDRAISLNPFYPFYYTLYKGMASLLMHRYAEALDLLKRSAARNPEAMHAHLFLAACLGLLGDAASARAALDEVFRIHPGFSTGWVKTYFPYKRAADLELLVGGLRLAGLSD